MLFRSMLSGKVREGHTAIVDLDDDGQVEVKASESELDGSEPRELLPQGAE